MDRNILRKKSPPNIRLSLTVKRVPDVIQGRKRELKIPGENLNLSSSFEGKAAGKLGSGNGS